MTTSRRFQVAALCLNILSGCQSLDMGAMGLGRGIPEAKPRDPVREIVCLWEPAEGTGLDGQPARGFAGQMLFFTAGHQEPVQVDGDVSIFVFDDWGAPEEQAKPIHEFDFSNEAWNTYLRETNVGAAYQLFIPYTRKGGYSADCVLRVRVTPENGLPVYSKMSTIHLAGRRRPDESAASSDAEAADSAVEQSDSERQAAFGDLAMPIDVTDISNRQPASLSMQRPAPTNTASLDAAIAALLRESVGTDDDDEDSPAEEPQTGRYSLSGRHNLANE